MGWFGKSALTKRLEALEVQSREVLATSIKQAAIMNAAKAYIDALELALVKAEPKSEYRWHHLLDKQREHYHAILRRYGYKP